MGHGVGSRPMRFVKSAPASPGDMTGYSRIANRSDLYPSARDRFGTPTDLRLISRGDFLSRLWALFGEPDEIGDEGFVYWLRDSETGLAFSAYAAGSGPAYGGGFSHEAGKKMLRVFEEMLSSTPPADCVIRHDTDFGTTEAGAHDGVPFDRDVSREKGRP